MTNEAFSMAINIRQEMSDVNRDIEDLKVFMCSHKFTIATNRIDYRVPDIPIPESTARSIIKDMIAEKQKRYDELKKQFEEL